MKCGAYKVCDMHANLRNRTAEIVLLFLPLAIFLVNPRIPFGNGFFCDGWFYFGVRRFGNIISNLFYTDTAATPSYIHDRAAAILPYTLLNNFFSDVNAQYIGFLIFYYMFVFSFFYIISSFLSKSSALFMAVIVGLNIMLVGIGSTDYVAFEFAAYTMLAFFLISRCTTSGGHRSNAVTLCLAGGSFACAVSTHLQGILYALPGLLLLTAVRAPGSIQEEAVGRIDRAKQIGIGTIFIFIGFASTIIVLSVLNIVYGTGRDVLSSQIAAIFGAFNFDFSLRRAVAELLKHSPVVPYILLAIGLVLPLLPTISRELLAGKREGDLQRSIILAFLIMVVLLVAYYSIDGYPLSYSKYIMAAPLSFLAIVAAPSLVSNTAFSPFERADRPGQMETRVYLAVVAVALLYWLGAARESRYGAFAGEHPLLFCGLLVFGGAALTIVLRRSHQVTKETLGFRFKDCGPLLIGTALVGIGISIFPDAYGKHLFYASTQKNYPPSKQMYRRVHRAVSFIVAQRPKTKPQFWIDRDPYWETVAIKRAFTDCSRAGENFPELSIVERLHPQDPLVIVSAKRNAKALAIKALKSAGWRYDVLRSKVIRDEGIAYTVYFGRVAHNPAR